jgi:hypothetical protein
VTNGITWTNISGSTITLNAPISGVNGGLTINTAGSTDLITTGASGSVNVSSFILQSGSWNQDSGTLPAFTASHDFELQGGSTFLRVTGGDGVTNPYQIVDVYGLEGLGSPSLSLLNSDAQLANDIDATGTSTWNGGAGFVPIGGVSDNYTATFDGQNHTINGLVSNLPNNDYVGLFGELDSVSTVENVNLTNEQIYGSFEVGGVVGGIFGTVLNCTTSGLVQGGANGSFVGGVVGGSSGLVNNCSSSDTVNGDSAIGGLVGANGGGTVDNSETSGMVSGNSDVGGLVGADNGGIVENSSSTASVNGTSSVGGLIGDNNGGTVTNSNGTGPVNGQGGGGGGGGGSESSTTPSTDTGGADGGGSNIVPPAITPQTTPSAAPPSEGEPVSNVLPPPLLAFGTNGSSSDLTGSQNGELAAFSSSGGQVGAGDAAQLGANGLGNVANPVASGELNVALGPVVYHNLADALKELGDWANVPPGPAVNDAGGGEETILGPDQWGEMDKKTAKNIPQDQVPQQLKNALGGDVLNGMPSGTGH